MSLVDREGVGPVPGETIMRQPHSVLTEATDAGFLGGTAVALWYLLLDLVRGHPLRTPSVLGQVFLLGVDHPDVNGLAFGAIVGYTAVHFVAFVLFALIVAVLVRLAVDQPVVRFALLVLLAAFEFFFYVIVQLVSEEVGALFPLWTVVGANLLALTVMGMYFWRRYPEFSRIFRSEPLGT
jgi:hypothetical protein